MLQHAQQQGRSSPRHLDLALQSQPRKRRRAETNVEKCVCKYCPKHSPFRTSSLLCLPDEAVSLIFTYLNAGDTSGDLLAPRHAFALALTNTRLLGIFRTHLSRVVPCLEHTFRYVSLQSPDHLLSVMRIAGHSLRELHVPCTCHLILSNIHQLCPRIETIFLEDWGGREGVCCHDDIGIREIARVFLLPLRSLSVDFPTRRTLELLPRAPQELSLFNACIDCAFTLGKVLLESPKKLYLDLILAGSHSCREKSLDYLRRLCPTVEEFTLAVKVRGIFRERPRPARLDSDCLELLSKQSRVNVQSRCRKLVLMGAFTTDERRGFLECTHPEAHVEVTISGQTFVFDGDTIYPTRIPLWDEYLTHDLSRLTHVLVGEHVSPRWRQILSNVHLIHAKVDSTNSLQGVLGEVDTVELDLSLCAEMDWKWIRRAKEVRLVNVSCLELRKLLEFLSKLLDQFQGKGVFLDEHGIGQELKDDYVLRSLVLFIRGALHRFEAHGGNAVSVRCLIDDITQRGVSS